MKPRPGSQLHKQLQTLYKKVLPQLKKAQDAPQASSRPGLVGSKHSDSVDQDLLRQILAELKTSNAHMFGIYNSLATLIQGNKSLVSPLSFFRKALFWSCSSG